MDTQLVISGLRKRKSLEEESSTDSGSAIYTPANYKKEETESLEEPSVNADTVNAICDVMVSGFAVELPAAAVNTDSQDDLVSQHAKVAEEAIAGWEKAEIEAMILKQQLEAFAKQNSLLEDRVNHLDCALKEVVSELRQANEKQEVKIQEAVLNEMHNWELRKIEFVDQISQLQSQIDLYQTEVSSMSGKLDFLAQENHNLKMALRCQSEELEIRTIERDLSVEAAEKSSKLNLESIKKVARLEAENRRLRSAAHSSLSFSDQKSGAASSLYADSFTDSHSDSGEQLQAPDINLLHNLTLKSTECLTSCSCSHALIKTQVGCGIEIDLMDDFLEIERLVSLPETVNKHFNEPGASHNNESNKDEIYLQEERSRAESLEKKIDIIEAEKADLQIKLGRIKELKAEIDDNLKKALQANHLLEEKVKLLEMEKSVLETSLIKTESSADLLKIQHQEAEMKINEMQRELTAAYETQQSYKSQVMGYELEAKTIMSRVESLESKLKMEKDNSAELTLKCEDMEDELFRTKQELELLQSTISSNQLKIKQDDLAAAAGKLAECQQTIASLGIQLKSLASLDDLLTDTASSQESLEILDSNNSQLLVTKQLDNLSKTRKSSDVCRANDDSPASSSSSSSTSSVCQASSDKGRNGFIKLFSRSNRGKVPT